MRFYSVDSQLIEINNIRNIQSLSMRDLAVPTASKREIVPLISVIYDGGKQMHYCSKDKYFDAFVRKITEVYKDEKDNVLEDSLTDPFRLQRAIAIDARLKEILESKELLDVNKLYQFYQGKKSYDSSLLFEIDELSLLMKMIKYHLGELLKKTDHQVVFDEDFSGYRDNYMMSGTVNGIYSYFPFKFDKVSDSEYLIEVGGLFEGVMPVKVKIQFGRDRIAVVMDIPKYGIHAEFTYLISTEVVKEIKDIERNGLTIQYENKDLEQCENEMMAISDFDAPVDLKWFRLPWGAFYGIKNQVQEISEAEKIVEMHNMYVDGDDKAFMRKESYAKNYKRKNTVSVIGQEISLDEAKKSVIGICLNKKNKVFLIETAFLGDSSTSGYYEEHLKKRYFYHLVRVDDLRDMKGDMLVNIGNDDGILQNSDILNDSLTLSLVGGK